jgi:hypothetical protein
MKHVDFVEYYSTGKGSSRNSTECVLKDQQEDK